MKVTRLASPVHYHERVVEMRVQPKNFPYLESLLLVSSVSQLPRNALLIFENQTFRLG